MPAATAPEFRGAHRHNAGPKCSWRALAIGLTIVLSGVSADAEELAPWAHEPLPPLALDRLDGPRTDLAALRGNLVIVHFFATWCEPCIEEMASLNALAAQPQVKVTILAVDVGEVDARVRRFFQERPVSFPVLLDRDRAATKAWQVQVLPTSFVLDHALQPALKAEGAVDWASPAVVEALMALSPKTQATPAEPAALKHQGRETIQ